MTPSDPFDESPRGQGSGKLAGRAVFISGGGSGIGRAVALLFAREGARVAITYHSDPGDAQETLARMRDLGGEEGLALPLDASSHGSVLSAVGRAAEALGGRLDVLVLVASMQAQEEDVTKITPEQAEQTFRVNALGYLWTVQAALPHMGSGGAIVATVSVVAYKGNPKLVDYAMSKGAELALVRSLVNPLLEKGIRINGVAPGPIWTPFILETMDAKSMATFGQDTPMGRPGQAWELAPAYLYLASDDSTYVSGQVIHVNGGTPVGG